MEYILSRYSYILFCAARHGGRAMHDPANWVELGEEGQAFLDRLTRFVRRQSHRNK